MAEWQNGGVPFQLPQLAGSIVEEPVSDLNEIDFDLESPEPHSGETLISSQPTTQWPHRLAGGFESFSEGGDTQRTQSFAASSTICPSFLRQTSILRYAFRRTQNPFESEVLQLCNDTGLDKYQVYSWFEGERDLWRNPTANGFITPETTRSGVLPSNLYPDSVFDSNPVQHAGDSSDQVLQTNANAQQRELSIRGPRTRKRPRQAESLHNTASSLIAGDPQKRPRRESGDDSGEKQFSCPSCSSKSKTIDRWRTHQTRKHFPTKLYICRIKTSCKLPSNKLFKTKDSFRNHLRNSHGYEPGKALDEEVSERTFKVTGLFHDECGFCPDKTLGSRGESMEHIMSHIRDGDDVSKWVHKCSSLDHELLPNVHFVPPWDFSEMMNDLFDEDDTDQEDFGGRGAQGGDNDFDDGEGYFEYNSGQGPEGGSSSGCAGEEYPPTSSRGASGSAADRRADMLKLSSHSDEYDAKSNPPGPIQRCTVVRNLGAGGFGTVLEVSLGDPKQTFALKTFRQKHTSPCDVSHYHDFKNEVRMLKALRHPHIIKFVGSYTQAERYSLLLSPVADMDLSRYMRTIEETSSTSLSIRDRSWNLLRGMSSLASALSHIHSSSVWHCDIKPANILVKDDRFILADFGLSRFKPARGIPIKKTTGATRTYAPPEIVNHGVQSSASDVFSLGCVFAELSTLIENKSLSEFEKFRVTKLGDKAFHQTLGETNEWIELLEEEQKRRRCFDQAHSIPFDTIRRMLSESPKDRLTAHEVWLKFPECTCCSDWGSINHQSSSSQDDEESSLASNRDWGGRDKAGQPAGSSIRPSVPARPTSPSHTSRTLFPTADIVSSAARSSPMSDSNPATLGKPQGDTTLGDFSVLHSPQKSSPLVDIVCVHGLSELVQGTGTAECTSSVNWRDFVPMDPKSRVMNFGYHSNWTGSDVERSRTTIYAKDLLKRLANFRKGCPERPILFVAHRLGGLIVKEALKIAKDCLEFSEVYHATRAVVFLGVKKNSPFERWDEVTLLPEVECSNDGENPIRPPAAPTIVRCFEDTSTPTASDESDHHAGTNMRCLAEDHDFSRKLQSPIAMANTFANRDDLTSIKATLREPRRFISTSRVPEETQAERHALWLSIIQKSYNLVLKYKQKERHLSGVSKADVFRFAVACH